VIIIKEMDKYFIKGNFTNSQNCTTSNFKSKINLKSRQVQISNIKYNILEYGSKDYLILHSQTNKNCKFDLKKNIILDNYDINVEIRNIEELKKYGWEVTYNNKDKIFQEYLAKEQVVIGIAGRFNIGKTEIMSQIAGENLKPGYNTHTEGFSVKYSDNLCLIDTPGGETPINYLGQSFFPFSNVEGRVDIEEQIEDDYEKTKKLMIDKYYVDELVQEFLLESSDILILVVNQLTFNDQQFINKFIKRYKQLVQSSDKGVQIKKQLFIIHNYAELKDYNEVITQIQDDILSKASVKAWKPDNTINSKDMFDTVFQERGMGEALHLVLARKGESAGNYFNPFVFHYIDTYIKGLVGKKYNIMDKFNDFLNRSLPKYMDYGIQSDVCQDNINSSPQKQKHESTLSSEQVVELKSKMKPNEKEANKDYIVLRHPEKEYKLRESVYDIYKGLVPISDFNPDYEVYIHNNIFHFELKLPGVGSIKNLKIQTASISPSHTKGIFTFSFRACLKKRDSLEEKESGYFKKTVDYGKVIINPIEINMIDKGFHEPVFQENSYQTFLENGIFQMKIPFYEKKVDF
jgi:hypothetical protein